MTHPEGAGEIDAEALFAQLARLRQGDPEWDRIRDTLVRERVMATLSAMFGVLAALLAAIGLHGIISYNVERRRREIASESTGKVGAGVRACEKVARYGRYRQAEFHAPRNARLARRA